MPRPLACCFLFLCVMFPSPRLDAAWLVGHRSVGPAHTAQDSSNIVISSTPEGAAVFFDDAPAGVTPLSIVVSAAGRHVVRIQVQEYLPFCDTMQTEAGTTIIRNVRLIKPSVLKVSSQPGDAEVYVNDSLRGKTPLVLDGLVPGALTVGLVKHDFTGWRQTMLLEEGKTTEVSAKLSPTYGRVSVMVNPEDADVLIDGLIAGRGSLSGFAVPAGKRSLTVRDAMAIDSVSLSLYVPPGSDIRLQASVHRTSSIGVVQSLLVPGLGQTLHGQSWKGVPLMAAFAAAAVYTSIQWGDYSNKLNSYNEARTLYLKATTETEANRLSAVLSARYDDQHNSFRMRSVGIGVLAAVYVTSLVDMILSPIYQSDISIADRGAANVSRSISFSGAGVECTWIIPL